MSREGPGKQENKYGSEEIKGEERIGGNEREEKKKGKEGKGATEGERNRERQSLKLLEEIKWRGEEVGKKKVEMKNKG